MKIQPLHHKDGSILIQYETSVVMIGAKETAPEQNLAYSLNRPFSCFTDSCLVDHQSVTSADDWLQNFN